MDKTGKAVHETNKASLLDKSFLTSTSNKCSGSTLPISKSEAISKYDSSEISIPPSILK